MLPNRPGGGMLPPNRCGNCGSGMEAQDQYCRYCGTKRGEGKFHPAKNNMYCVYGPPIKTKIRCKTCGHTWNSMALGRDRAKYCPKCGPTEIVKNSLLR